MNYHQSLTDSQIREHIDQTQPIWGGTLSAGERCRFHVDRHRDNPEVFSLSAISLDGKIVSSLKRYYFSISIEGQDFSTIGLGAIFTRPEFRKRGLAEDLIRRVLEDCGRDLALLYSDIGIPYYASMGFEAAPAYSWSVAAKDLPETPPLSGVQTNVPPLAQYERWVSSHFPVFIRRNEITWQLFHTINRVQRTIVFDEKSYLSYSVNEEKRVLFIDELCATAAFWGTVRTLAESLGLETIRGWWHPRVSYPNSIEKSARPAAIPMLKGLTSRVSVPSALLNEAYFSSADHL